MDSQDLKLQIGIDLSTQNATQQLQQFKQKVERTTKIHFDDGDEFRSLITYVNEAGQSFRTLRTEMQDVNGELVTLEEQVLSTSTNFDKLNKTLNTTSKSTLITRDAYGNLITTIEEVNANGDRIVTTITEYTNALGELVKETQVYNATTNQVLSTDRQKTLNMEKQREEARKLGEEQAKQAQIEKEKLADTSKIVTQQKSVINGNQQLITTTREVNAKGETLVTTVTEVTDKMGNLTRTTSYTDANCKKVAGTFTEISKSANGVSDSMQKTSQSFGDVITKVAKFYLASLPIRTVQTIITNAKDAVVEFDKAITEFTKVTNLSGEAIDSYTNKLADLGTEVGRTKTTMVELATGFRKAGYSEEDVLLLAKYGALLQNTADEELEASEATSVIVSALKAFGLQASDTMRILDDINIVSQDFAVSSADISRGLTQAGASMATYGNSLEQTISLITAGENFLASYRLN